MAVEGDVFVEPPGLSKGLTVAIAPGKSLRRRLASGRQAERHKQQTQAPAQAGHSSAPVCEAASVSAFSTRSAAAAERRS